MKHVIILGFALLAVAPLTKHASAQTTVVIATKVCSSASGSQVCNYVPVDASNPLEVAGTGTGGNTPTVPGKLTPMGYQHITAVTLASAQSLTVPTGATIAYFVAGVVGTPGTNGVCVMWRDDGTSPTASLGMPLGQLQYYNGYTGKPVGIALSSIQFIEGTNASCDLNVSYYQ